MSPHILGILIGGVGAAVFYGVGNLFVKAAQTNGLSPASFLIAFGVGSITLGTILLLLFASQRVFSLRGAGFAFSHGIVGGLGLVSVVYALEHYKVPLATISPIFNANTLITVLLALWVFAEWKDIHVPRLIIGAVLIVIGSVFVARA